MILLTASRPTLQITSTQVVISLFGGIGNDFMNPFYANSDYYQNKGYGNAFNEFRIDFPATICSASAILPARLAA